MVSTAFFFAFGIDCWRYLAVLFALVPAINICFFATCPIERLVEEGKSLGVGLVFPLVLVAMLV